MVTGYRHEAYVQTLTHIGRPHRLSGSDGWALLRRFDDSLDAVGPYPSLFCSAWSQLPDDLAELGALGAVSFVAMVPAPLEHAFDVVGPWKAQYLARPDAAWSQHHLRNLRRARVETEVLSRPEWYADRWVELYGHLAERHGIAGGDEDFPPAALRAQLEVPGTVVFGAFDQEELVGALVWYDDGAVARYHLGAYSPAGYGLGASFALFDLAFQHFADRELLDLGRTPIGGEGLARFKLGLGARVERTFVCGKVLDRRRYELLCARHGRHDWFPAYRSGQPRVRSGRS